MLELKDHQQIPVSGGVLDFHSPDEPAARWVTNVKSTLLVPNPPRRNGNMQRCPQVRKAGVSSLDYRPHSSASENAPQDGSYWPCRVLGAVGLFILPGRRRN